MSTISVLYYELNENESDPNQPSQFVEAIKGGWAILVSFVIGIFYLRPFILIRIAAFFFFIRFRK